MGKTTKVNFKPRARLLIQLGEKLIRNENIAVLELIKNSYDADANNVEILFNEIDDLSRSSIIIKDDGFGMTDDVIKNVWLEPGADFKDALIKGNQLSLGFEYDKPIRKPIGEKGVGRFGVHKLGDYIEMVTKSKLSSDEIVVKIDWRIFEKEKYIEDAKFEIEYRNPKIFKNGKTGTYIKVTLLRKEWDKVTFKDLSRSINSLNSPFQDMDKENFNINVKLDLSDNEKQKKWSDDITSIDDIEEKKLWYLEAEIENNYITKFEYTFTPYKTMDKLSNRNISLKDFKEAQNGKMELENGVNLGKHKIGKVGFKAYLFDLSPKLLKLGLEDPRFLKQYLHENGGVRVYREGLRVYDYGEQGNDWLHLDRKRINDPTQTIGNRNILGFIQLNRSDSLDLVEKTNREGFTENEAYIDFQKAVSQLVTMFAQERNIDKDLMRTIYEGNSKNEPVHAELDELRDIIEESFEKEVIEGEEKLKLQHKIFSSIEKVKNQYEEVNNILLKSAGAGLSLGVALHEVEKRIKELHSGLKNKSLKDLEAIYESVNNILKLIEGYARIMSNSKKTSISLDDMIKRSIFNSEFRFKAHKIETELNFLKSDYKNHIIHCVENITLGVLLNIFDNSIYWLERYKIQNKKISINIKDYDDSIGIIIADNGKGFSISPEIAIKPFISKKNGGMGLGLYIADEMMKSLNGTLNIRQYKELDSLLSTDYKNGAIVELIFPKK